MLNKLKSPLFLVSLVLMVTFAFSCTASSLELTAGGLYTTLTLPDLNEVIDEYNSYIEDPEDELEDGVSITTMDNINSAFGFHGGTNLNLNRNLGLNLSFENFSAGTGTEISYEEGDDEIDFNMDIDLSVNGAVAMVNFNINDYLGLTGGGGYYLGSVSMSASGSITYDGVTEEFDESDSSSIGGLGYKFGGLFTYPLANNASLFTSVCYRMLELAAQDTNVLTNEEAALEANGIEVKFGVSFSL